MKPIFFALRNLVGSFNEKASKSGGEMITLFNHLFLYGIIGVERGEFLVNELRKIMGLDEGYKVIKVEEKKMVKQ